MWTYAQSTGKMTNTCVEFQGYSGTAHARNNPAMQNVQGMGPIPQGTYKIGDVYNSPHLGPVVMNLVPCPGTNVFGRSLFRIHGNNVINDASHGCIILDHDPRRAIADSEDRDLTVTE